MDRVRAAAWFSIVAAWLIVYSRFPDRVAIPIMAFLAVVAVFVWWVVTRL